MVMAAFSQHSSNPLDRGSSDNTLSRKKNISLFSNSRIAQSSDDPLSLGGPDARMREFVEHLETVHPAAAASVKKQAYGLGPLKSRKTAPNFIDLDDDDDEPGTDELELPRWDKTITRKKLRKETDKMETDDNREEEKEVEAEIEGLPDDEEDADEEAMSESSSDDEENSLSKKSPEEQEEIMAEIEDLEEAVPQLSANYKLLDRLGTGTFSSVYKALDLYYHDKWFNVPWHGHHHTSSSAYYQSAPRPPGSKVYVAIKRIYVTSSPERIRNEISILDVCRSCRHVSQLITAFREQDQVVVIMPYQKNDDFRDYFAALPMEGIKSYMRCLLRALRDIHARRIIHRDVKPANFLFDPRTGIGTLCDFGLACRMKYGSGQNLCLHTPPTAEYPHGMSKSRREYDVNNYKQMNREAKAKSAKPSEEVGYLEKDTRPFSKANRAGTRGFRPPEVLLKCGDQTGAVDVWAAGMILLFFLTKKFPLFQSNDDVEALMEIATIIGRRNMEKAACMHSRTFSTNVPSVTPDGISWSEFVTKQNPDLYTVPEPDVRFYPYTKQLREQAQRQIQELDAPEQDQYDDPEHDENSQGDGYRPTPAPSSSPSHLSINTKSVNLSSASSLAFPSSPPKSIESGEQSPLTPLEDEEEKRGETPGVSLLLKAPSQEQHEKDVNDALDLVEGLLRPLCTERLTPRSALYHPFLYPIGTRRRHRHKEEDAMSDEDIDMEFEADEDLDEEVEPEDDEFFPHPFGEGVCRRWHFRDEVGAPYVKIYADEEDEDDDDTAFFRRGAKKRRTVHRSLTSGEGIAIGRQPCEFHRVGYELEMPET
ncbi:kinase-like domain-containing protein [Lentinula raphanica]|nr:kinase-like domain-containing protein [Lentinula raphanica]